MKIVEVDPVQNVQAAVESWSEKSNDPRLYYFINATMADYQPIIYGAASRSLIWVLGELLRQKLKNIFSRSWFEKNELVAPRGIEPLPSARRDKC